MSFSQYCKLLGYLYKKKTNKVPNRNKLPRQFWPSGTSGGRTIQPVTPVYKINLWITTTPISITPLLRRREIRCLDLTPNPTSTELRSMN
jgi:hypothetical protein